MRTVAEFRGWARRQWRAHWPGWLAGERGAVGWPLHPPTGAEAAACPDAVAAWIKEWGRAERDLRIVVDWVERRWPGVGRQRVPSRASATPAAMAALAGHAETWERASSAAAQLVAAWPSASAGLGAVAKRLGALPEVDLPRLLAVLAWLEAHPDSELWERELPVGGVDSKWLERHRALVLPLLAAIGGGPGLRRPGVRFAVRALDPPTATVAVGLEALPGLELTPARVLIVENLTTLETLPALPGTVAVHGMGFAAPTLAEVAWVADARQLYWGDLDTHGFAILGQVRAVLPRVESVLMDLPTLEAHRDLAVPEPRPFRGEIGYLTAAELHTLAAVRAEGLRLEQERIPRTWAAPRLLNGLVEPVDGG